MSAAPGLPYAFFSTVGHPFFVGSIAHLQATPHNRYHRGAADQIRPLCGSGRASSVAARFQQRIAVGLRPFVWWWGRLPRPAWLHSLFSQPNMPTLSLLQVRWGAASSTDLTQGCSSRQQAAMRGRNGGRAAAATGSSRRAGNRRHSADRRKGVGTEEGPTQQRLGSGWLRAAPAAPRPGRGGGAQGKSACCSSAVSSGRPNSRFMFWMACPLAPLTRLSITGGREGEGERGEGGVGGTQGVLRWCPGERVEQR